MKYSFDGTLVKDENGYSVNIPFNVWEICEKEGNVPAKVRIDEAVFVCNLTPQGRGYYRLPVPKDLGDQLVVDNEYHIVFRITKSEAEDSPYSTLNPIRKITSMEVVRQPQDGLCGQSCIAMLTGLSIDEVSNIMHCNEWQATMGKMISALNYFGFGHSEEIVYTMGKPNVTLPKCCIMMEKMGRYSHYLIGYDGKFYDSGCGVLTDYDFSNLVGYLEILV